VRAISQAGLCAVLAAGFGAARTAGPPPSAATDDGLILGPDEGDRVLSHLIKVDPARGSQRLGVGRQHIPAGRSIALHIHDGEDEVLYILSGRGVGVVGSVESEVVAGSLIYVPKGAWHGLKAVEPTDAAEFCTVVTRTGRGRERLVGIGA
jgi:quercetin dioxygenase-like cupin family protein